MNDLMQSKENLETRKKAWEYAVIQKEERAELLEINNAEIAELIAKTEKEIIALEKETAQKIKDQEELDKESKNIQNEITRLSNELKALQDAERPYIGGVFYWPVPKNSMKRGNVWKGVVGVSSGFGMRSHPITGRYEHHDGIDIPADYGADVWAANDGIVIISQYSAGYGNYIVIDHGGGKTTLYAHNSNNIAKVGDNVKRGDVIGKIGSTGWSTGNHLHLGYYENGEPKDPLKNGFVSPLS
jgi:murein DD-endopeptidase MepM/ murein hydrolase activator NlpD